MKYVKIKKIKRRFDISLSLRNTVLVEFSFPKSRHYWELPSFADTCTEGTTHDLDLRLRWIATEAKQQVPYIRKNVFFLIFVPDTILTYRYFTRHLEFLWVSPCISSVISYRDK